MTTQGQGHSLTFVQGQSDSTFSNFFSSETARRIEAKFHMESPWDIIMIHYWTVKFRNNKKKSLYDVMLILSLFALQ